MPDNFQMTVHFHYLETCLTHTKWKSILYFYLYKIKDLEKCNNVRSEPHK